MRRLPKPNEQDLGPNQHIVDEEYKGHEIIFIKQDNGFITVDIRIDNFDGEFIGGYTDFIDVANARNRAYGYIDGYHERRGYIATRDELKELTQCS